MRWDLNVDGIGKNVSLWNYYWYSVLVKVFDKKYIAKFCSFVVLCHWNHFQKIIDPNIWHIHSGSVNVTTLWWNSDLEVCSQTDLLLWSHKFGDHLFILGWDPRNLCDPVDVWCSVSPPSLWVILLEDSGLLRSFPSLFGGLFSYHRVPYSQVQQVKIKFLVVSSATTGWWIKYLFRMYLTFENIFFCPLWCSHTNWTTISHSVLIVNVALNIYKFLSYMFINMWSHFSVRSLLSSDFSL